MTDPKPLYRCDLCKAVDYNDEVIGCKRCGFDEMVRINKPGEASAPVSGLADFLELERDAAAVIRNALEGDLPKNCADALVMVPAGALATALAKLSATPCQYAKEIGMPEYRCVGKCQYELNADAAEQIDEDQFADCEDIVRQADVSAPVSAQGAEPPREWRAVLEGLYCAAQNDADNGLNDMGTEVEGALAALDPMNYKGMFLAAAKALAAIDALLGMPEDGCNDPQVTVSALADYIAGVKDRALTPQEPAEPSDLIAALDRIDDFIARCNGDDRGSSADVNLLRAALTRKADSKGGAND